MEIAEHPMVTVRKGNLTDLKRLRDSLKDAGIPAEIVRPPGCSTSS